MIREHLRLIERTDTFGGKKNCLDRNICEPEVQRQWQRGSSHSDTKTGRLVFLPYGPGEGPEQQENLRS